MDECKFQLGTVVTIIEGTYKGIKGVVFKTPTTRNKQHYTIITEDHPYGYWATEDQLVKSFNESVADERKEDNDFRNKVYYQKAGRNEEYDKYIPEDCDPEVWFLEMSEIAGRYSRNEGLGFKVFIKENEGPIPHVHVQFKSGGVSHIKLGAAEYLNGHEKSDHILTHDEKKKLQKFFSASPVTRDPDLIGVTNWDRAVDTWESNMQTKEQEEAFATSFSYDEFGKMIMPNYMDLP